MHIKHKLGLITVCFHENIKQELIDNQKLEM